LDALLLSRIQFGFVISFHVLFPAFTIGTASWLAFIEWRWLRTRLPVWRELYFFWQKIFAVSFGMGVVSGIVMAFQFGTNWPRLSEVAGTVIGPLLTYEVLTAFFLEATFLGIMLFGRAKVSNRVHTLATFLVAFGTTVSAFWIIVLNSWMQTPAGVEVIAGKVHVQSWLAVIFNPSMPYRLTHMLLASGLTVAFLVAGVSAYRWLRGDRAAAVAHTLKTGVSLAALLIPLQVLVGDMHGLNTFHHQPAKLAAIEGVWHTERGAPLLLFALPDEATQSNRFEVGIPKLASLIITHDPNGEIRGLNEFPNAHPPVAKVFWSFRVMVGMGVLMLLASWLAWWQLRRGQLAPWLQRGLVAMTFSGWVATVAGWYVTEIGRQPWLVTGILRTADAASTVGSGMILSTLLMYLALYVVLLASYVSVVFYLARKAAPAANLEGVQP